MNDLLKDFVFGWDPKKESIQIVKDCENPWVTCGGGHNNKKSHLATLGQSNAREKWKMGQGCQSNHPTW